MNIRLTTTLTGGSPHEVVLPSYLTLAEAEVLVRRWWCSSSAARGGPLGRHQVWCASSEKP